ncbi:MAG: hypothetical protein IKZ44_05130 [Clostridia bacterium]|nr:hypothetical protein [Clostridia bacterium]
MKTKLHSVPDWNQTMREIGWNDAPTAADVEKRIEKELTRGRVTFIDAGNAPIGNGFRVTLRIVSKLPKFNREKVALTVGSGLYDRTVEDRLLGMRVGESAAVTVKDEPVRFTVLNAEKKHVPVLTDEMVKELSVEDAEDLPAYRTYTERKLRTEYAANLCRRVLDRLKAEANMEPPSEEDVVSVIDLEYEPLRVRFSLDTLSLEEWKNDLGREEMRAFYEQIYPDVAILFGTTSKESFYASRRDAAKETIRDCLILRAVLHDETDPTMEPKAAEKLLSIMTERVIKTIYGG